MQVTWWRGETLVVSGTTHRIQDGIGLYLRKLSAQVINGLWVSWRSGRWVWSSPRGRFACTSVTVSLSLHVVQESERRLCTRMWNSHSSTRGCQSCCSRCGEAVRVCTYWSQLVYSCTGLLRCCFVSMLPSACMAAVVFSVGGTSTCYVRRGFCPRLGANPPAGLLWFASLCLTSIVCLFQAIAWGSNGKSVQCLLKPIVVLRPSVRWHCVWLELWWPSTVWLGPVCQCSCCVIDLRMVCMSRGILDISKPLVSGSCCPLFRANVSSEWLICSSGSCKGNGCTRRVWWHPTTPWDALWNLYYVCMPSGGVPPSGLVPHVPRASW